MAQADMELVREFAGSRSEPAFAELVSRHISLVHSAARRQVGDAHLAEEITQAVFIILARKAASLGPDTILSAWLYRTTRYASADALKIQRRRQRREQEACMQTTLNEQEAEASWQQLAPKLDEAMASLGETDRAAVVLRFFENKTAAEIATTLKVNEEAAQKRVTRALDKLRKLLGKRGLMLSAVAISGAVSANSVQAAPVGLVTTVTATAVKGAGISAAITALADAVAKTMTWLKIKFAAGVGAAVMLAGGAATLTVAQVSGGGPEAFKVEGFITRTRPGGTPEHFCDFSAIIAGEKSLIRVQYFNGESVVCGSDGRDSFLLNEMKPARATDPNVMEFASISAGPYPSKAMAPIQLVWLAYASAVVLNKGAEPWPLEGAAYASDGLTNEVHRFEEPPRLPREFKWWAPDVFLAAGLTNHLVDYPNGYLMGDFKAQSLVGLAGISLPSAWSCTWYQPAQGRTVASSLEIARLLRASGTTVRARDDVQAGDTLECRLTNVVYSFHQEDFLPKLGTNVSLTDYRFEHELGEGGIL